LRAGTLLNPNSTPLGWIFARENHFSDVRKMMDLVVNPIQPEAVYKPKKSAQHHRHKKHLEFAVQIHTQKIHRLKYESGINNPRRPSQKRDS